MPSFTRIPRGEKHICCARLMDGTARYCRRTATVFEIHPDQHDEWSRKAPLCDRHASRALREATA